MKVRSDSLSSKLTADQRDELLTALDAGVALKDALKLLESWGIVTSMAALSRFYGTHGFAWRLENAKAAAEAARDISGFQEDQARLLEQKVFETLARADVDPRVLLTLRAQDMKVRELDLAERRVAALESKLQKAGAAVSDTRLTPEEKELRIREALGL